MLGSATFSSGQQDQESRMFLNMFCNVSFTACCFILLGSVVLGVVYKDLHELFLDNEIDTNAINKTRLVRTANHLFCFH